MIEETKVLEQPRQITAGEKISDMSRLVQSWGQKPLIAKARMGNLADKNWNLRCQFGDSDKVFCAGASVEGESLRIKNQFRHLCMLIPIEEISKKLEICKGYDWTVFETSSGTIRIGCGSLQKIMQLIRR